MGRVNYCILRDSEKVRAAVEIRVKRLGLSTTELSKLSGIPMLPLRSYVTNSDRIITQKQLIKLCDVLGIDVDVKIEFR